MMPRKVTPEEAAQLIARGAVYLDVRSEPEFAEGHPKGAVNVPLSHMAVEGMVPNVEFLPTVLSRFSKDTHLVVGCKSGGRSAKAAQLLVSAGYTEIADQFAGWDGTRGPFGEVVVAGWRRTGLDSE